MDIEDLKKEAGEKAVEHVKSGMVLGLGTGSTTNHAIIKIGELWQAGELTDIVGIPTSERTATLARKYNIPLVTLDDYPEIDLAIDGADEVDPELNLIKGLGGALLREKIIANAARCFIVIADDSKLVDILGTRAPLPVEVTQFAWQAHARWLETLGCQPELRLDNNNAPYVTDNGNYIIDCYFVAGIDNPIDLSNELLARPGILDHGMFLGMANEVIIASETGVRSLVEENS
jgi:ribose 5-phosphate isomerase A